MEEQTEYIWHRKENIWHRKENISMALQIEYLFKEKEWAIVTVNLVYYLIKF